MAKSERVVPQVDDVMSEVILNPKATEIQRLLAHEYMSIKAMVIVARQAARQAAKTLDEKMTELIGHQVKASAIMCLLNIPHDMGITELDSWNPIEEVHRSQQETLRKLKASGSLESN